MANREQRKVQKKLARAKAKKYNKQRKIVLEETRKIQQAKQIAKNLNDEDYLKLQEMQRMVDADPQKNKKSSLNFLADRNGCGYYRMIWPFEMLSSKEGVSTINTFVHPTEFSVMKHITSIRFQRQVEDGNVNMLAYYLEQKEKYGLRYNIVYEIDDLLPEIDPSNKIAFEHFSGKTKNHLSMLQNVDLVTVSTETLKDVYTTKYGLNPDNVMVLENTLPEFLYNFNQRSCAPTFENRKPRVFWSGSGSHVTEGGDLDFMYEIIRSTTDKYQWVIQGARPPHLEDLIKEGTIEYHTWKDCYSLADYQFNTCKADIYVATIKPNRFNACKSDLKCLESSALGVPFIGTKFTGSEYNEYKSPYEDTPATTLVNGNVEEWVSTIDAILGDEKRYMDQVNAQYQYLNGRWMGSSENMSKWLYSMDFSKKK